VSETEKIVILDDMIYVFGQKAIDAGAFDVVNLDEFEHEWVHSRVWRERNIPLNVIGINCENLKYSARSGNVNVLV
jgi:hypothetical protein